VLTQTSEVYARLVQLGYGTADIGNHRVALSDADADRVLAAAWASGIRLFDSAPHYGLGLAERRLGRFLAHCPRTDVVVSTKVGRLLEPSDVPGPDTDGFLVPATHRRLWDFSPAGVRQSLEESLGRLGLDRVDVVYLHDPEQSDLARALGEGLETLVELRREGLVTAIGVGSMHAGALAAAAGTGVVDLLMVAGRHTILDHSPTLLAACRTHDVGIVAAAVFNGGLLADPPTFDYRPAAPALVDRIRRIDAVCASFGVPLRAAALRYPLREPLVRSVVAGATTPGQVRQNAAGMAAVIPAQLWVRLEAEGLVG
jgi:D-threo-aldose 1-dehydrogenase